MADKKSIVIKVKYPVSRTAAENHAPKMITEWNVKRISLAGGGLIFILAAIFAVFNDGAEQTATAETPQLSEVETRSLDIPKQAVAETGSSFKPAKQINRKIKPTGDIKVKTQANKVINKTPEHSKDNKVLSNTTLTGGVNNKCANSRSGQHCNR